MLLRLIIHIFLFSYGNIFAQGEANNWYFGDHAGITFNNGVPEALTDGVLSTEEGCATISNSTGQLLFYTDGITVYNRGHNIMPNGTGLLGDISSSQSSIIVPKPNDPNIYYVFTVDDTGGPDGLRYSIVDMSLDAGFGAVTATKNILLMTPISEKINAVLHANGQDIWVLSHGYGNDAFYAYLVSSTGLNTTPTISTTGVFVPGNNGFNAIGVLKASPSGNKLVMCVRDLKAQVFNFNRFTGIVSNPVDVYTGFSSVGAEFSPSGSVLYLSHGYDREGLWQYDLTAPDIPNSGQSIYQVAVTNPVQEIGQLQLGIDNKIYVSIRNRGYLSVINNPESIGVACNFNADAIFLEGNFCKTGLPAFIQSYFFVGFQYENVCQDQAAVFTANISQTYDSLLWDFGDGNTSTSENPSHIYTTAGDYTVTLTVVSGSQTSTDTKLVTVFESPIVATVVQLTQCDDDVDGYSVFNLNEAIDEITANALDETITFYESQFDAENTNSPITNTSAYINENVSTDTVWARVENSNGCYKTSQVNLIVSTTQIPLTFTRDFYACDDSIDGDSTNGISSFNFSSVTTEIEALFPVGQQLIISYYNNLANALAENNPILNITDYRNMGSPVTQEIFIRVDSTLDNDCLGLGQHITLHVEMVPVANPVSISEQCDDDGDGMYAFDTTNMESTLLNGQTNVIVAYTDENGNSLPSPLPNPFNTAAQTITARVTNDTSQDPEGACFDETTIDFYVSAAAVANPVPDVKVCDDNNDGLYAFDTSTFETTILNGQTGMQVTYTDENGNALPSPLPNPFISETQTITVRVENSLSSACYDETIVNLIVYEQPIANTIQDDFVCDVDADGSHNFVLADYNPQILTGQSDTVFEVNYFDLLTNAENNVSALQTNYTSTSTSETIFARIHNRNNTDCYALTSFQIGASYLPIAYQPEDLITCNDEGNDGEAEFDLSNQNNAILNGQSETENRISFHLSQVEANDNLNAISTNYANSESPQTIYVRLENSNNNQCYSTTSFNLVIVEKPVLLMDEQWSICEGDSVEIMADAGFDEYLWSTGETTQSITVYETGTYEVIVTNIYGNLRCEDSLTITVVQSDLASITNIETVDWSQSNNEIIVSVSGNGDYEYSIDGINYQNSNYFTNLNAGEYTVYVRDRNGCGIVMQEIYLMYYPKFFTPNNDGYQDYWQLHGSKNEPNNIVYIYDRYRKLLKQLYPTDTGWDGTFNGSKLPTTDYWFLLKRQNGKQYRGHFTLKN